MTTINASGLIGNADLVAGTPVNLGTIGATAMSVNVLVCNRNASPIQPKVRIAFSMSAIAPGAADYIDYDVFLIAARDRGGIAASPGENIWVQSDTSNVSARAHGVLLP